MKYFIEMGQKVWAVRTNEFRYVRFVAVIPTMHIFISSYTFYGYVRFLHRNCTVRTNGEFLSCQTVHSTLVVEIEIQQKIYSMKSFEFFPQPNGRWMSMFPNNWPTDIVRMIRRKKKSRFFAQAMVPIHVTIDGRAFVEKFDK